LVYIGAAVHDVGNTPCFHPGGKRELTGV